MELYRLAFVMHEPCYDTEDKYLAEVPALPGCRAWGDTPAEAVEYLRSVAGAFIESYIEHNDELPAAVKAAALNGDVPQELVVAA